MSLIELLRKDLNSSDSERIQYGLGAIYWIADLFRFGGDPHTLLADEPYRQEIIDTELNSVFESAVKDILRNFIEGDDSVNLASAIGILGKFADKSDVELFEKYLESSLVDLLSNNGLLHQTLFAFRELSLIDTGQKHASDYIEKNVDLARKYLNAKGKVFPS